MRLETVAQTSLYERRVGVDTRRSGQRLDDKPRERRESGKAESPSCQTPGGLRVNNTYCQS